MFTILKKDKGTKARLGLLKTAHGTVKTPAYVFVGTYGRFLHLKPADLKRAGAQLIIANTFHLWKKSKKEKDFLGQGFGKVPTMTDSGGFQVLSLAFEDKNKISKFMTAEAVKDASYKRTRIRITSKGVKFFYDNKWRFLGPELSMKIQSRIGADIIFAFDQITSPLDDYEYNRKAVAMTDRWAKICLTEHAQNSRLRQRSRLAKASGVARADEPRQMLFGIVQGGTFNDLRKKSARSIGSMPFDGFGIGGSYTKEQIAESLRSVIPHLPDEKPRHLLGVGKVADVFEAVENGIDTFDCVIPTREARHGRLYTKKGHMDIRRGAYTKDKKVIEKGCGCLTCASKIPRSTIRTLIKDQDMKKNARGQRWCLMHNMWFFNNLLEEIRASLERDSYQKYKAKTLASFNSKSA